MSIQKHGLIEFQKKIKDLSARDEGFFALPVEPRPIPEVVQKMEDVASQSTQRKRRSKRIVQPEDEDGEGEGEENVHLENKEDEKRKPAKQAVRGRRKKARRDESQYVTGRWLEEEHQLFLIGLKRYGRSWCLYKDLVKTRSAMQIRTHAQKFFKRIGGYIPEVHGMSFSEEDIQKKIAKLDRASARNQKSGSTPPRATRLSKRVKTRKLLRSKPVLHEPNVDVKTKGEKKRQHDKEEELAAAGFLSLQHAVVM